MADTKITALTALTAADPVNDMFPIVDVSDTTMAASGTTKKISVNNILGASGTATLASATITGDLTVDTNVLKVNTTTDRVGIGTASPLSNLHVGSGVGLNNLGVGLSRGATTNFFEAFDGTKTLLAGTDAGQAGVKVGSLSNHPLYLVSNNTAQLEITHPGLFIFNDGAGGTRMTLNSTGLGIGGVPSGVNRFLVFNGATQALTLDTSGNLLVGVASSGNRLDIQKSTDCAMLLKSTGANTNIATDYVSNYGNITIRKSGTAVWDFGVINDSSATPAFKISNGSSAVGVQLVSGATAWTTLSDETVKDIIEPISNAVAKVGSLRSVIGKFKTDDASKRRSFLIAQDVQSVLPEAVDVIGENNELGLRYTEVIPLLVAAIKELTAEVNALKKA